MLAKTGGGHCRGEASKLLGVGEGLGEDHIGPGFNVAARPIDGRLQVFNRGSVGAGHDHEARSVLRVQRGLQRVQHHLDPDDLLAVAVAATLGVRLVLQMNCGRARATISRVAGNRQWTSPSRITIDQQRQLEQRR